MREDLETAMGVALTSRSACACLLEEPSEFLELFELEPQETQVLLAMAEDLAALMPGFVVKRERNLARALQLPLALLGDEGPALVEEYCDSHPEVETMMPELLGFADFLEDEARVLADSIDYGRIIVDSVRFERLRLRSFGTPGPLSTAADRSRLATLIDQDLPLALHPSVCPDHFGWDLRTLRSRDDLPRMRTDPCTLVYFQWGEHGEQRVLRLDEKTARAVGYLGEHPGVPASDLLSGVGATRPAGALLGKLVDNGIIVGAGS